MQVSNILACVFSLILYNIEFIRKRVGELVGLRSQEAYDVFVAHDWGVDGSNHARVAAVNDALKRAGLVTWFDEERMRGDIVQQMTDGIDRSSLVLVFITRNYIQKVAGEGANGANDNCKAEFDYACNRKGVERMLAVVMEEDCTDSRTWQGAVGMRLGSTLYQDLSGGEVQHAGAVAKLCLHCAEFIRRNPQLTEQDQSHSSESTL